MTLTVSGHRTIVHQWSLKDPTLASVILPSFHSEIRGKVTPWGRITAKAGCSGPCASEPESDATWSGPFAGAPAPLGLSFLEL